MYEVFVMFLGGFGSPGFGASPAGAQQGGRPSFGSPPSSMGGPGAPGSQGRGGAPVQTPGGGWQATPGHPPPGPDRDRRDTSRDHGME